MRDNGLMENKMVKESIIYQMELSKLGFGKMVRESSG